MMFDAYLVDLLAQKDVLTDRQTDRRTFAFLELLSQLKRERMFYIQVFALHQAEQVKRERMHFVHHLSFASKKRNNALCSAYNYLLCIKQSK